MLTQAQVLAVFSLLGALGLGAACSSPAPSDPNQTPSAGSDSGGGGSNARAGAAGRTGAGGRSGAGNVSEGGASTAGSGDATSEAGEGGEGGSADPCAACPSGFCLPGGECVDCLPSNDHCPSGQYCTSLNECASGCKNGAGCASGVCDAQHDCQSCLTDDECSAPQVCGNNDCAPACTAAQDGTNAGCGKGLTCCSQHCVDAASDSKHCGACGTACTAGQFCGIGGCLNTTVASVCSVAKAVVVLDGATDGPHNEAYSRAIASALQAQCTPAPSVREVQQTVSDVLNVTTFRPVAGGDELLIAAGGGFFQHVVEYVSTQPITPVFANVVGKNLQYVERATNLPILSVDMNAAHDAHDFFVIQLARDASSGSLIFNAQGFWESGTAAATFYFDAVMLPAIASQTKSWYAFEWTDADGDFAPDANEIKPIASGI